MIEKQDNNLTIQENNISLKELIFKIKTWFDYLIKKWIIILFAGIIGASIGFYYASIQKIKYTASLSFALEDEKAGNGGLSGAMGLASSLGIDLGTSAGGAFSGANLLELMKSRTIIEKVLLNGISFNGKTISLADYYLDFSGAREGLAKNPSLANIKYLVNEDRTNYSLEKDSLLGTIFQKFIGTEGALNVSQKDKKISIISVDVKTENEVFSKILAETLVKEVTNFYISTKSKKARSNVEILQKQVDSIRNELNSNITSVAQASDNTFNLNSAMAVKRTTSSKRQVDVQFNTAILTQLVTNLEMAKVTLLKETPLIQIIDKPILPLKKEKIGRFRTTFNGGVIAGFIIIIFFVSRKLLINVLNDFN